MLKKILVTVFAMLVTATSVAVGLCYDEPTTVEASVAYPRFKDWNTETPWRQISVVVGDGIRFGVSPLTDSERVPKYNTVQSDYDNYVYNNTVGGKYHTATEDSVVFYGYGGGTSDTPGTSSYYANVQNYIVSNQNAHKIASGDDKVWLQRLQDSRNSMNVRELYYTQTAGGIYSSVDESHNKFNQLRQNLYNAFPTYTDLLSAFYDMDSDDMHRNTGFVAYLVNTCGLSTGDAQVALGWWLGNQVDLNTDINSTNTGAELAFYNACTGSDWVNSSLSTSQQSYQRMLSLISVYICSIRAGSDWVDENVVNSQYVSYKNAIENLVDPEQAYITYAPCMESTIEIVYNPSGAYDTIAGVPAYEFNDAGLMSINSKECKGAWTFEGSGSNNACTITLTTAQQFAILSGKSVSKFCKVNGIDTGASIREVMGNGGDTPWNIQNQKAGLTMGIWSQYGSHGLQVIRGNLTPWDSETPTTSYMIWGYSDSYHSGNHYGSSLVGNYYRENYNSNIWDAPDMINRTQNRADGKIKISDLTANIKFSLPTSLCNTNVYDYYIGHKQAILNVIHLYRSPYGYWYPNDDMVEETDTVYNALFSGRAIRAKVVDNLIRDVYGSYESGNISDADKSYIYNYLTQVRASADNSDSYVSITLGQHAPTMWHLYINSVCSHQFDAEPSWNRDGIVISNNKPTWAQVLQEYNELKNNQAGMSGIYSILPATSWQGRDGDVDSAVDSSPTYDMTSLFTMYQYVYGFNMWYQHSDSQVRGKAGLTIDPGSCSRNNSGNTGLSSCTADHATDTEYESGNGDFAGYAGVNSGILMYSATGSASGQETSNKALYMTARPNTYLYGFKMYLTGAVWTPTVVDAPMKYSVKTELVGDGNGVSHPSGDKSWEYGYLDDDTFGVKNTVVLRWDTSTAEKAAKVKSLRNNALLVKRLNYYGDGSGVRLRGYTYTEDSSDYCGTQSTRYTGFQGHYKNTSDQLTYKDGSYTLQAVPTSPGSGINPGNESHAVNFAWNEGQTVTYLDSYSDIRGIINGDRQFATSEILKGDVFPQEHLSYTYNVRFDLWYSGGQPNGSDYYYSRNQRRSDMIELPVTNVGGKTVTVTRTTQYAAGDSGSLTTTNELKEGSPNNEKYEALAAVPTINAERKQETLYYSVGGVPYKIQVNYHTEFNKSLSGYNQCNYVYIDSCTVYEMDYAELYGTSGLLTTDKVTLNLADSKRSTDKYNIDIKFEQAKAVASGNNVTVTGDSLYGKDKNGNWVPLFSSAYMARYNGRNLADGYDSIRDIASEKSLAIDQIHANQSSIWQSLSLSRNQRTNAGNPVRWANGGGQLGEFRGYSGVPGANKYDGTTPMYADGLKIRGNIENRKYGPYHSSVYYLKMTCSHTKNLTREDHDDIAPKFKPDAVAGYTNPVIVQDPIAVSYQVITAQGNSASTGTDVIRSYYNNQGTVEAGGEPYDQRIGKASSQSITDANHVFIDYDFAIKLDYTSAFGGNGKKDLSNLQSVLGYGFSTDKVTTSPWISYVWVKFTFAVSYGGRDYTANSWIPIEKPVDAAANKYSLDRTTTVKTYGGFHIPLYQGELDDGVMEVKIQGVNYDNGDVNATVDRGADYATTNKVRRTSGSIEMFSNRRAHVTQNKVDVVGHIGALTLIDTGDFRFSNYFKKPTSGWLVEGLLKQVDLSKQNGIVADSTDVLRKASDFSLIDPYNSLAFARNVETNEFPLSTLILQSNLQSQPMKLGYSMFMSLETVGNYYGNKISNTYNSQVEIKPRYYYVSPAGDVTAVDAYVKVNGAYKLVNEHASGVTQNPNLYEYFYTLDWLNEKTRRMYTESTAEMNATGADEPSNEKTVHIGNMDYIFLRKSARTYFGNQSFNNNADAGDKQAQRWHFTLGLPSGTVFVKSGETPKVPTGIAGGTSNILDGADGGYVISTLEIISKGDTWILGYDNTDQTLPARRDVPVIPDDGGIPDPEIPVIPVDPGNSAASDLTIKGTH